MRTVALMLALALLTSGCALTTASIDVPYQPEATAAAPAVPGASSATVSVTAADGRTNYRDRVSSKKNGYGMEMAAITASNDIPQTVGDAIKRELATRGFKVGSGGADVSVEVVKFYNDFKTGIFSGDAVAEVAFNVKVVRPNKTLAYSKFYDANGTEPNIQIMGADNARAALIAAFRNAVNSVMSDPDFLQAIVGGQATASAAPSS